MNSRGGIILIGVDDGGKILGLDKSFKSQDKALLYFADMFNNHLSPHLVHYCKTDIVDIEGKKLWF